MENDTTTRSCALGPFTHHHHHFHMTPPHTHTHTPTQGLRTGMCDKLNRKKNHRTVEILETTYKDADIQFLQEVAATFIDAAGDRPLVKQYFDLHYPLAIDKDRNQNSLILLKKGLFTDVEEVSDGPTVLASAPIMALITGHKGISI